jgi:predicted dehydrogenase
MVDHTFIYTGAVRKIKEITESGEIGKIYYFDSVRVNLGLFQHDVNVIWDLAPHDISIMDYVIGVKPLRVRAVGNSHIDNKVENIAYIHIDFENDLSAHLHINWLAPVKVRRIIIGGSNKMIVYDDNEPSEKVKIYDKGVSMIENKESIYQTLIQYRTGDMYAPKLDHTEALQSECGHFVDCIKNNTNPLTGGESGAKVVKILEAADMSIRKGGRSISL